ncbi:hypothetical protein [Caulobacter radicis]|uniref:hypothetical protein n=1 Tax=Caulobacter radicis TaxID=2172650 RepID=UPI001057F09E|nr:hypothetical protein [Caulobacter radicis]
MGWVVGGLALGGVFLSTTAVGAAEPVDFCRPHVLAGRPLPARAARLVCDDPLVSAQARAVESLLADQRRADEWAAIAAEDELRAGFEACADDPCVRAGYENRLAAIVEGAPFPLAGGLSGRRVEEDGWRDLWSRDLGRGWRLVRFEGVQARPGRTSGQVERGDGVSTGAEMFVAREEGGLVRHRRSDGGGFDITTGPDGRWRVVQVGDCLCGPGLSYDGVYIMGKGRRR